MINIKSPRLFFKITLGYLAGLIAYYPFGFAIFVGLLSDYYSQQITMNWRFGANIYFAACLIPFITNLAMMTWGMWLWRKFNMNEGDAKYIRWGLLILSCIILFNTWLFWEYRGAIFYGSGFAVIF